MVHLLLSQDKFTPKDTDVPACRIFTSLAPHKTNKQRKLLSLLFNSDADDQYVMSKNHMQIGISWCFFPSYCSDNMLFFFFLPGKKKN